MLSASSTPSSSSTRSRRKHSQSNIPLETIIGNGIQANRRSWDNPSPINCSSSRSSRSTNSSLSLVLPVNSESLESLCIKYDITVEQLMRLNRVLSRESLQLKNMINVPIHHSHCASNGHNMKQAGDTDETVTTPNNSDSFSNEREMTMTELLSAIDEDLEISLHKLQELFRDLKNSNYQRGKLYRTNRSNSLISLPQSLVDEDHAVKARRYSIQFYPTDISAAEVPLASTEIKQE